MHRGAGGCCFFSDSSLFSHGKHLSGLRREMNDYWIAHLASLPFSFSVKTGEVITIDILALRTPLFVKVFGSFLTLMMVQARGWPYIVTFWALMDFCFMYGSYAFAQHWLFWQDWLLIFNESNPAGEFLESVLYTKLLLCMVFVGLTTALKRLWLATFLGRRSYNHYGPQLVVILAKMLLLSSFGKAN